MKFLQLVVGGILDVISETGEEAKFQKALSLACFGLFPNLATLVILLASLVSSLFSIDQQILRFPGSKIIWAAIMVGMIFVLLRLRYRILAPDRVRITNRLTRGVFLVSYFVMSLLALTGSFMIYAAVLQGL